MKNVIINFFRMLILIGFTLPVFAQENAERSLAGNWLASLEAGGVKMRLLLKVEKTGGGYSAKLDSVDQGVKDLPIDSITFDGDKVNFSAARFGMSYQGTLDQKTGEISGTFKQGAGSTPLVFRRVTEIVNDKRRQDPEKPYPYNEEEVGYRNEKDNVKLAGTLTLPRGEGKFPAVILITGSGTQDRDSTIAGHRPFLVLADYLTRKGIAVLRVDDRGAGGSDPGSLTATSENYVGDVLAGVEYLKSRKEIDRGKIGLIGHSEGGNIAPMAAASSKDVAFIVMLAGMGQTGTDVILTQLELILRKSGVKTEAIAEAVDLQKSLLTIIVSEPGNKAAAEKINEMLSARKSRLTEAQRQAFEKTEADIKAGLPALLSPWYRYFLAYDPRPTLAKVKVPVLALNGENDLQVPSEENLALIAAALRAGGNKDFTVKSFPELNHLFQTSKTGLPNEYGALDETFSPLVLKTVADWIMERTTRK